MRLLAVLLFATTLGAQARDDSTFVGVPWGASHADASKIVAFGNTCETSTFDGLQTQRCRVDLNLEEVWPKTHLLFIDGRFSRVTIDYESENHAFMVDVLKQRYGPPASERTETFSTRGGAEVENEIITWTLAHVSIDARSFGTSIDRGMAVISWREWAAAEAARRLEAVKKAAERF